VTSFNEIDVIVEDGEESDFDDDDITDRLFQSTQARTHRESENGFIIKRANTKGFQNDLDQAADDL
jgi:hypothetical protein